MPTLAIVGAGPGMGLAIARTFGSQGYNVALIARNRAKLDDLVGQLTAQGITAAAWPASAFPSTRTRSSWSSEAPTTTYSATPSRPTPTSSSAAAPTTSSSAPHPSPTPSPPAGWWGCGPG